MLDEEIRKMLGRLIFEERQRNNTHVEACCRALNISPLAYEKIELGLNRTGWARFEKALKYFHKNIEIRLVDAKQSKTPPCA
ncbi:MAG: hypothetical protein J5895_00490 [Alphaproteobacteria bacterium]|nr:hypothetical protein [Alphaproteobacteria bacterium]